MSLKSVTGGALTAPVLTSFNTPARSMRSANSSPDAQSSRSFDIGPLTDFLARQSFSNLEHAIGVAFDLEWFSEIDGSKIIAQIEGKLTQVGWTVFPMAALKDCQTSDTFTRLMKTSTTHFVRII
jgi:hypothetical protein